MQAAATQASNARSQRDTTNLHQSSQNHPQIPIMTDD